MLPRLEQATSRRHTHTRAGGERPAQQQQPRARCNRSQRHTTPHCHRAQGGHRQASARGSTAERAQLSPPAAMRDNGGSGGSRGPSCPQRRNLKRHEVRRASRCTVRCDACPTIGCGVIWCPGAGGSVPGRMRTSTTMRSRPSWRCCPLPPRRCRRCRPQCRHPALCRCRVHSGTLRLLGVVPRLSQRCV